MFIHCPNCTSKNFDFLNQHKWSCTNCGFEYFHNVAASVAALIVVDNEILLTKRAKEPKKGFLDLPGGFVDPNESLEQALTREIAEELGVDLNISTYLTSCSNTYTYKNIIYKTCDSFFICYLTKKPKISADSNEISSYQWIDLKQINDSKFAFESSKLAIQKMLSTKK